MAEIVWSEEKLKQGLLREIGLGGERKLAAVLVPIVIVNDDIKLIFEKRPDRIKRHAGEVSFPGGLIEEGEGPIEAALREAEEEIGLDRNRVRILGYLEPEKTRSTGFLIVPVVGLIYGIPRLKLNRSEIDEVFLISLEQLITHKKEMILGTYYKIGDIVIWGATARIVEKLLEVMEKNGLIRK